jgi:hypothetical protein
MINFLDRVVRKFGFVRESSVNIWDRRKGNLRAFQLNSSDKEWRQLMMYNELMYKLEKVPGDIAEFGVAAGISLISFFRILKNLEEGNTRKFYGFDSFEGLPELSEKDVVKDEATASEEMKKGGYAHKDAYPELLSFAEKNSSVKLLKGWFNESVPKFFSENPETRLAFIHMDADLYDSTKTALENSWNRLVPGGIILFDELHHPSFPGETLAFEEFFKDKKEEYSLQSARAMPSKYYIVKIRPVS